MYQSQVWAWQLRATRSESEFLEEEVGSCLLLASLVLSVSLLEFILKLFFECLAALRGVHLVFGGKRAEFEVLLDHESGREDFEFRSLATEDKMNTPEGRKALKKELKDKFQERYGQHKAGELASNCRLPLQETQILSASHAIAKPKLA